VSKTIVLSMCSFVVAVTTMYFFRWLTGDQPPGGSGYDFVWEKVFVSTVVVFSFVFGLTEPKSLWRWLLLMAYVHYFSGFFIMRFWGQIPPFELFVYCVACTTWRPCGLSGLVVSETRLDCAPGRVTGSILKMTCFAA
jgi:hypothetical protein